MQNNRNIGLDIIRAVATLFVFSVHFFYNTKFYDTLLIGKGMYAQLFLRMTFIICVPLFILLTGYLQLNKQPTKSYYKKIIPILVVYFIYSILSIFVRIVFFNEVKSVLNWIIAISTFSANGYSWYINMYIGLFLISPFLNVLYNNLETKRQKQLLLSVFIILTSIPEFINGRFIKILFFPTYWLDFYPITYYFIGAYIREYQPKIKKLYCFPLLVVIILLQCFIELHYGGISKFSYKTGSYASLNIAIQAVVFFIFFYDVNIKNKFLVKFISMISLLSLDMYLVSYITDSFIYKALNKNYFVSQQRVVIYFVPVVFASFIFSFAISYIRYKTPRLKKIHTTQ